jgi:hypothetical protein
MVRASWTCRLDLSLADAAPKLDPGLVDVGDAKGSAGSGHLPGFLGVAQHLDVALYLSFLAAH